MKAIYRYLKPQPLPDIGSRINGGVVMSHDEETCVEYNGEQYRCQYYTIDRAVGAKAPETKLPAGRDRGEVISTKPSRAR